MSTRCEIEVKFNGKINIIYQHFDGYLEGVGKELIEKWKSFELAISGEFNNEETIYKFSSYENWIKHLDNSDIELA